MTAMRSAAGQPMSAAKQFKTGVSERSGPEDWRVGLERSRAMRAIAFQGVFGETEVCAARNPNAFTDLSYWLTGIRVLA
jgi:hypothetical protein